MINLLCIYLVGCLYLKAPKFVYFYPPKEEVQIIERIVESEASVLDFDAKVAVAQTVWNRVLSDDFPDTVSEVSEGFSTADNGDVEESTKEAVAYAILFRPYPEDMYYFCSDNAHSYGYDYVTYRCGKWHLTFRTETDYNSPDYIKEDKYIEIYN